MAPSRLMHEGTTMFEMPDGISRLKSELEDFMANHIYPSEAEFYRQAEMLGPWAVFPLVEDLKAKARKRGLWHLWHAVGIPGVTITKLEYAQLFEILGRTLMADAIFQCSHNNTGDMEKIPSTRHD